MQIGTRLVYVHVDLDGTVTEISPPALSPPVEGKPIFDARPEEAT